MFCISTNAYSPCYLSKMITMSTSPYLLNTENKTSAFTGNLTFVIVTNRTGEILVELSEFFSSVISLRCEDEISNSLLLRKI